MLLNREALQKFYVNMSDAFTTGLGTAESQYQKIAMVVASTTATNVYPFLGTLPSMRKWAGERVIRNLKAHSYAIENETFETTIAVKRNDLEDGQSGMYEPMFSDLGHQAGVHPNQLTFGLLKKAHETICYDGKYFFDANHPVGETSVSNIMGDGSADPWYLMCASRPVKPLIFQKRRDYSLTRKDAPTDSNVFMRDELLYGVDCRVAVGLGLWQCAIRCTSALNETTYAEARAAMRAFKNDEGTPLALTPDLLVVPQTHEGAARALLLGQLGEGGKTNTWIGSAELLVSPWL